MIRIAEQELATKDSPSDLAARVLAATGLGLDEVPAHIATTTIAGVIAALLIPWLVEPIEPAVLAEMIETGDRVAIVGAVAALYTPPTSVEQVAE